MPSLVFPALVRAEILRQHADLRELLADLAVSAQGDQRDDRDAGRVGARADEAHSPKQPIDTLVRCLFIRMQSHLAYEDQALRPVLYFLDSFGPERVHELDEDHARQRSALTQLVDQLESGTSAALLAADLRALAADLLHDMDQEEERCLRTDLMASDYLTAERR